MSEGINHGNISNHPIRKTRKIPVMTSTHRTQSGCSTDAENNPFHCCQTALPRSRLGNRFKKPVLSEHRLNQIDGKALLNPAKRPLEHEISRSTPDLSRPSKLACPKVMLVAKNLQKIYSLESLAKPKPRVQPANRVLTKPMTFGKLKHANETKKPNRVDAGKKPVLESKRGQKPILEFKRGQKPVLEFKREQNPVENKRKLNCAEISGNPKQKITAKEILSPSSILYAVPTPKNRIEDCSKIVRKIMLDKKSVEANERKRSSGEFEDSIGTFNSDEMVDLLLNDSHLKHLETSRVSSELDKSSKRNSSEFDDSIGSFFSDQMVLKLSNEFLSGKQSYFNDNLVPEDLDNLTPGLSDLSNGIDRTPSAEDLPMECEGEPEANSIAAAPDAVSARSTSPELPQESLSSRIPNAPVSIITSITSIMSLDTGYQGDGELSRPESRNTENDSRPKLPVAENGISVKTINFDDGKTMTDSDFFTESDADVHDDLSAAAAEIGSGKGDRKAQVIDGTLYGGAFMPTSSVVHHEPGANAPDHRLTLACSSTNEDMESSGIYSDLEKKSEEIQPPVSYLGLITEQMKTIQNLALLVAERKIQPEGIVKSSSAESSSTVQEVTSTVKTSPDPCRETSDPPKKNKMPNRNVSSKIKALIETPAIETETRTKTLKKGKWDAVMDKIAQGKEENKYTPSKFRDIKSKVFQNMGPLFSGRKNEPEAKASSNAQSKARSRRSTRIRSSESSLVSPKSKLSRTSASPNSSQRSSLSDISLSGNPHHKSATRASKKRDSISPQSTDSTHPGATQPGKLNNNDDTVSTANGATPCRNSDLQNGNIVHSPSTTAVATMKTPSIRKTPIPRRSETTGPSLHRTASVPLKDSNHNGILSKSGSTVIVGSNLGAQNNNKVKSAQSFQSKSLKVGSRGSNPAQVKNGCLLAVAKETNKALLKQLKHNSKAFESLAILFAYCANDLDAFSTPHLKQRLETEKSKFSQAQSDLKELQSRLIRVREELNDKELVICELKHEKVILNEESENFRKLVERLRAELKATAEEKVKAESELLRECEDLKRELSLKTDSYETEKNSLVYCLGETKNENEVLKTVNEDLNEEYNKCLLENQRLVELMNKRQQDAEKSEKANQETEDASRKGRGDYKEKSPATPVQRKARKTSLTDASSHSSLESEVESLRYVLALKTDEVTELRRQELTLRENADRLPKLLSTIAMLEGKVEDLQTQLSSQTETVRDLFKSNDHLEEELKSANIQKTRLMQQNEELQYKLKQYAEAMKQLANQKNLKTELSPAKSNGKKSEGNLDDSVKSQMKGVVEKSDSVSYMLEMTEDSSEIVTNIIRRAESLRSTGRDVTVPRKRRTKATSVSSSDADVFKRNSSTEEDFRPLIMSTPGFDPEDSRRNRKNQSFDCSSTSQSVKYPVKLSQDDFSTDSIELTNDNDCEVIEITKNFDKPDKMATSTSSTSSSSNGSHFDIESDVFSNLETEANLQNVHDPDEDTESSEFQENESTIRTFRREVGNIRPVLPVYADLDGGNFVAGGDGDRQFLPGAKTLVKIPKVSGGEAMIGLSSDDEDIDKLNE